MSTARTSEIASTGLDNTLAVAARVGRKLRGGEVIVLSGDLGAGKTAFVRGLAQGLGSPDHVHSPSFTLSNQYRSAKLTLHHFDFYRLDQPGIMRDELQEILTDPENVVVIEWADIITDILPLDHLIIQFTPTGETTRKLACIYPDSLNHLFPINT